ncbi:tetratricopeptide repeat protein [Streptomyces phytophilus]|uniref:tetratricopeptide repeat protein n=1 Tax=Streptomyces phytophilus TaxID=722715 RepID=UPI0015F0E814|nr:tetratricopeptide repeat protein [Streptomyces phytophilus]
MTTSLQEAYASLQEPAAHVYRQLALLAVVDVDAELVATACVLPVPVAGEVLTDLAAAGLLEEHGTLPARGTVYALHEEVRVHARDHLRHQDTEIGGAQTLRRVVDWLLATTTAAERRLTPARRSLERDYRYPPAREPAFTDDAAALVWLDAQHPNLIAAIRAAHAAGLHRSTWQLVHAMWPWFKACQDHTLWFEAHRLAYDSARCAGHALAQREILTAWGVGLRDARLHRQAVDAFTRVHAAADAAGDDRGVARALHELGSTYLHADRPREAEAHLRQARWLRQDHGDAHGVALTEIRLGRVALALDRSAEALTYLSAARATLLAHDHRIEAAWAMAWLGRAQACDGDYPTAERNLLQSHDEFTAACSPRGMARTLEMLGETAEEQLRLEHAALFYTRARDLYRRLGEFDADRLGNRIHGLSVSPANHQDDGRPGYTC